MIDALSILLRGFVIGLSIAAPVGPIGVLCMRRTLSDGKLTGFLCGLGAATADMIYGAIAAFGLTLIMKAILDQSHWLKLVGGVFLLYLGIKTLLAGPAGRAAQVDRHGPLQAYLSTLLLTLANPMTILSFLAIFAGVLPANSGNFPLLVVAGVFAGSACWWLALSLGVGLLRERVTPQGTQWITRLSGLVILLFGASILLGNQ